MKQKDNGVFLLYLSIAGFLLMSVSFLLMSAPAPGVLPGLMFWSGLAAGMAGQILLEKKRRDLFKQYGVDRTKMQKPRCGFLTFGSSPLATVADIAMPVCLVLTMLAFQLTDGSGYLCYVGISATVFALCMHCVLNGRNFFHVNNQSSVRQALERKKKSNSRKGEGEND